MAQQSMRNVVTHLRRVVDAPGAVSPSDADLLERYVAGRDQAAFELLVWRHGGMVWRTCRRLLHGREDAEDAFQATFLALVRRAAAIGKREAVAAWLHKVAFRVAGRARAEAARRGQCERQSALAATRGNGAPNGVHAVDDAVLSAECRQVLDDEVNRLPAKLRAPIILCYLEGLTNDAAARQLGCPKGTVLSRLARARQRLRDRLARRGLVLSAGALTALAQAAASAAPVPLILATLRASIVVAAGNAGVVSAHVATLTEGVLKTMFLSKLKIMTTIVLGIALVAAGTGGLLYHSGAAEQAVGQEGKAAEAQAPLIDALPKDAKARLEAAAAAVRTAESQLQRAQAQLDLARVDYEAHRAHLEVVRAAYEQAMKALGVPGIGGPKKESAPPIDPLKKKDPPPPDTTGGIEKGPTLGGTQADLISLATAYSEAFRELETAKLRVETVGRAKGAVSEESLGIARINLTAAERKVKLLHAIVESSLQSAEADLKSAARAYGAGFLTKPRHGCRVPTPTPEAYPQQREVEAKRSLSS